jgi:hypothetical protein
MKRRQPSYYRGERMIPKRRTSYKLIVPLICIAAVVIAVVIHSLHSDTKIGTVPPPVVSSVATPSSQTVEFNEPDFTIFLPSDWELLSVKTSPIMIYHFTSTGAANTGRLLDIYLDAKPTMFGVNRMLPVQASGNRLELLGEVSNNCTTFTQKSSSQPITYTAATWDNVGFLCDLGNYERDVVGTSSPEGPNKVTLTGTTTGNHSFFFAFTDNTPSPQYSIFTEALKTVRVK